MAISAGQVSAAGPVTAIDHRMASVGAGAVSCRIGANLTAGRQNRLCPVFVPGMSSGRGIGSVAIGAISRNFDFVVDMCRVLGTHRRIAALAEKTGRGMTIVACIAAKAISVRPFAGFGIMTAVGAATGAAVIAGLGVVIGGSKLVGKVYGGIVMLDTTPGIAVAIGTAVHISGGVNVECVDGRIFICSCVRHAITGVTAVAVSYRATDH